MNQDLDHLRLLSVFHYVVGGLAALFSLFPVIHLAIGIGLATGAFDTPPEARGVGCFFIAFAGAFIAAGLTLGMLLIVAGRKLARQESYTFCLVMAAISCLFMPFGTVLGIFTIIVLMRDSVKELFGVPAAAPGAGTGGAPGVT